MSARLAVDAVIDGTEDDDGQVERSHCSRYRQVLVRLQELDVTVVGGDSIRETITL